MQNSEKQSPKPLQFLREVSGKAKWNILWLLLSQALLGASSVYYALLTRDTVDHAAAGDRAGFFTSLGLFALLVVFQIGMRALIRFLEEYARSGFQNRFKERLFSTLLTRDFQRVSQTHSGEWMNRLTSDTRVVADGLATIVPDLAGTLVRIVGAVGMLLYLVPRFAPVLLPGGVVLAALTYAFRKRLKRLHKEVQEKDGATRTYMQENLESAMVIRAFAVEQEAVERAAALMAEHHRARLRRNHFSNFCNVGFGTAMRGVYVLGLAYCGCGLLTHTMSYGTLMGILQLISQVQSPVANVTGYIPKYYAMIASAERLMEAEDYGRADSTYRSKAEVLAYYRSEFSGIRMEHVDFAYEADNPVLRDFSMSVKKGEFAAFTGMSGCGKSTVLKLLLGLYRPDRGSISVDSSYRRLFAYVPQGNLLMSGTLRDVVTMANTAERGSEEKLREALQIACAEFAYELPDGIDTVLGERGLGLSEGQMQRLAVARAIFSACPILILDEATSALDAETERQLLKNLRAMTDKTVLIVTHRPAALSVCNQQIVFGAEA